MHADICDSDDKEKVALFRQVLQEEEAKLLDQTWGMGIDLYTFQIGQETLTVFSDTWLTDMEGSPELVNRILQRMKELAPPK